MIDIVIECILITIIPNTFLGFDKQGATQLGHKLVKTKKWIGATEISVALKFIGLRYTEYFTISK